MKGMKPAQMLNTQARLKQGQGHKKGQRAKIKKLEATGRELRDQQLGDMDRYKHTKVCLFFLHTKVFNKGAGSYTYSCMRTFIYFFNSLSTPKNKSLKKNKTILE